MDSNKPDPIRLRAILQDHPPQAYLDREQRIIAEVWEALPALLGAWEQKVLAYSNAGDEPNDVTVTIRDNNILPDRQPEGL